MSAVAVHCYPCLQVPVVDGFSAPHLTRRLNVAGRHITAYLADLLTRRGYSFNRLVAWRGMAWRALACRLAPPLLVLLLLPLAACSASPAKARPAPPLLPLPAPKQVCRL